jgi:catechol 2,3-dioxygenase-like lactoylglutathione lyase family enzyme|tara:strand:- start:1296 stop:1667 length:372 start_codon:yes stop_codon:yes gene_type:complete
MSVTQVIPQIRTTDIDESIDFYVNRLGFELDFRYEDFYAGIKAGDGAFHLKLVDDKDPSIDFVRQGDHLHLYFPTHDVLAMARNLKAKGVTFLSEPHDTDYSHNEFSVVDNQGHVLFFADSEP